MSSNDFKPKLSFKFYCNFCDYGTSKKSNIDNHFNSLKHAKSIISNENQPKLSSHPFVIQNEDKKSLSQNTNYFFVTLMNI